MKELVQNNNYRELVQQISETFQQGQRQAVIAVNSHLVDTYWKVGQYVVEYEQHGKDEYVSRLFRKRRKHRRRQSSHRYCSGTRERRTGGKIGDAQY